MFQKEKEQAVMVQKLEFIELELGRKEKRKEAI